MNIVQTYARQSSASINAKDVHFDIAQELSRENGVSIYAMVNHSLDYARIMLALQQVVVGDWRTPKRDVAAYQEWVNQQYKQELPQYFGTQDSARLVLYNELEEANKRINAINLELMPVIDKADNARRDYYNYLYHHDREKWIVLDPVISVHPDSVIFEAFSIDESSYARVTVPKDNLDIMGDMVCGTTNIDFSRDLVKEFQRVRNYRPAWIKVERDAVELSTDLDSVVEKKIDLPLTWIRGFLQVQSASVLPGTSLQLSAETVNLVLSHLTRNRAKESPRSLRFILKKGEKPTIIIDPWGLEVPEYQHTYQDVFEGEIRIWGRRRLMVLKDLLPFADRLSVRLMGTGMPSYWSLSMSGHRFDLGLSGWTANDWAAKANFSIMAATDPGEETDIDSLSEYLRTKLMSTIKEAAKKLRISNRAAAYGLQLLCEQGQAMYDPTCDLYRWRQLIDQFKDGDTLVNTLFQPGTDGTRTDISSIKTGEDKRMTYAKKLVHDNCVKIIESTDTEKATIYKMEVVGRDEKIFKPDFHVDLDGRISVASCTCSFFRLNKLRKGPCNHIGASILFINDDNPKEQGVQSEP